MNQRQNTTNLTPEHWEVLDLKKAYEDRGPLEYIVDGLFEAQSLSTVYGPPGTLKSMLLADLAVCVASGEPWLPPSAPDDDGVARRTLQSSVLICDFDNNERTTHDRIAALARARDLPDHLPLHYVTMPDPWLAANNGHHIEGLIQLIRRLEARLVIVDNLRDVSGGVEENSAEMGDVMANLRKLTNRAGAAIILIHHQRKNKGRRDARSGDALRGHSSIEAALDLALQVERSQGEDVVRLWPTKVRGAQVRPFGAKFQYRHKEGTDELERAWFAGLLIQNTTVDGAVRREILRAVKRTPGLNKSQIKEAVKEVLPNAGKNRIDARIEDLAKQRRLIVQPGSGRAKHYTIAENRD